MTAEDTIALVRKLAQEFDDAQIARSDAALVVGELVCAHIDDALLVDGRVDVEKLRPIGRLGGDGYAPLREILHLPRPKDRAIPAALLIGVSVPQNASKCSSEAQ